MDKKKEISIDDEGFIIKHLEQHGNCCVGRVLVKKYGVEHLLDHLFNMGYKCKLEINTKDGKTPSARVKYPEATYILWLD